MQDAEDELLFADRVAGLDIAKAGVEVTIRVPSDTTPGRRQQETRTYGTTRAEMESLGDLKGGDLAAPRVHRQPHSYRHRNGAPVRPN